MENNINWEKYFDAIYAINYLGYKNRKIKFLKELDRVGITSHSNFILRQTVNNQWFGNIVNILRNMRATNLTSAGTLSLMLGHYFCINHAYENNYKRVLILEDDMRFLKDLNKITEILEHIPQNDDMIFFDKFPDTTIEKFDSYKEKNRYDEYYCKIDHTVEFFSGGCYSLNQNGIKALYEMYNRVWMVADGYFRHLNINKFFSYTNIAVQLTYGKSMNVKSDTLNAIHNRYKVDRLNYDLYNMRENGEKYDFGDYIDEEN